MDLSCKHNSTQIFSSHWDRGQAGKSVEMYCQHRLLNPTVRLQFEFPQRRLDGPVRLNVANNHYQSS